MTGPSSLFPLYHERHYVNILSTCWCTFVAKTVLGKKLSQYSLKSSTASFLTTITLIPSRCIFLIALAAYSITFSNIRIKLPFDKAIFGPAVTNKFGNSSTEKELYAIGNVAHLSFRFMPLRPFKERYFCPETSKPVAHTIASTFRILPSWVSMPFGWIHLICVLIKSTYCQPTHSRNTFDCTNASKYPGPGVNRRHPGGKEGRMLS